jgi:hypothetical protein
MIFPFDHKSLSTARTLEWKCLKAAQLPLMCVGRATWRWSGSVSHSKQLQIQPGVPNIAFHYVRGSNLGPCRSSTFPSAMPHSVHPSPVPDPLPYWNVNIPTEMQTAKCPDFLLNLSEKDIGILSTTDEDYQRQSWPEVQELVSESLSTL